MPDRGEAQHLETALHSIRQNLTLILGFSELLLDDLSINASYRLDVRQINEAALAALEHLIALTPDDKASSAIRVEAPAQRHEPRPLNPLEEP